MTKKKESKPKVDKEDFIEFMIRATPQEINERILNRGKPAKLYCPFYFFRNTDRNPKT